MADRSRAGKDSMKMVMVVFRDTLKDHMVMFLKERDIKSYTLMHEVAGAGQTGEAIGSFAAPNLNSMILVVLPDKQAEGFICELHAFRDSVAHDFPAGKVPMRAFLLPCSQAL